MSVRFPMNVPRLSPLPQQYVPMSSLVYPSILPVGSTTLSILWADSSFSHDHTVPEMAAAHYHGCFHCQPLLPFTTTPVSPSDEFLTSNQGSGTPPQKSIASHHHVHSCRYHTAQSTSSYMYSSPFSIIPSANLQFEQEIRHPAYYLRWKS